MRIAKARTARLADSAIPAISPFRSPDVLFSCVLDEVILDDSPVELVAGSTELVVEGVEDAVEDMVVEVGLVFGNCE